jgi:uncharacterized membrane protein YcaP (DUF421 family)
MFFESWWRLAVLVFATTVGYAALVLSLRLSGKRTLSKLNAFDFVVTVALGSLLATVSLSREIPLAEGVAALALVVLLQFVVTAASLRSRRIRRLVRSSPRAIVAHGRVLDDAMREERITIEELGEAVRKEGHGSFAELDYVVLETDGTLSVIRDGGDRTALAGVHPRPRP